MTATLEREDTQPAGGDLVRPHLTTRSMIMTAALVAVALVGLFLITPLGGIVGFVLVFALVYVAVQTIISVRVEGGRRARDRFAFTLMVACFALAMIPLVLVLFLVIQKGAARFDLTFFTSDMRNITDSDETGGALAAIIGTFEQVAIASLISVPFGLLVAIYLVEYGRGKLAQGISFFVDVMTGLPSIVAGLFILSLWIIALGRPFTGFAGSMALAVLMLPIVVRSTEEILKIVPDALREASFALGVPRWKTIMQIVVPTALPGIVTGVMLAVARVSGETAPVLLTVFGADTKNLNPFEGAQTNLPLFIYSQAGNPSQNAVNRAWTAALTLILIVMMFNLLARFIVRRSRVS